LPIAGSHVVLEKPYLDALRERCSTTSHLPSLQKLFTTWDALVPTSPPDQQGRPARELAPAGGRQSLDHGKGLATGDRHGLGHENRPPAGVRGRG